MPHIGLLNEKPLHAALKQWYVQPGDRCEAPVSGFVIDIVRDDVLIEIQTGHFTALKAKLAALLNAHRVRVVYPIVRRKWIVRAAAGDRRTIVRRRSPKAGRVEEVFRELVSIADVLSHRNFTLEVVLIEAEEVRRYQGRRRWRNGGWSIDERRLVKVLDREVFAAPDDWRRFVPGGSDAFTTLDLAAATDTPRALAEKIAYCLRKSGVIDLIGKRGRAKLYRLSQCRSYDS